MNVPFYIARRFFFRRGKRTFVHSIAWLSVVAIALGLTALTVGLSIFNGLEKLLKSKFEHFEADISIVPAQGRWLEARPQLLHEIANREDVQYVSPVLESFAMAAYEGRYAVVKMKGITQTALIHKQLEDHRRRGEITLGSTRAPKALLGEGVAYTLGVSLEDYPRKVTLTYPRTLLSFTGKLYNQALVQPAGFFSVEASIDEQLIMVPLQVARTLIGTEQASAWELYLREGVNPKSTIRWLQNKMGATHKILDQQARHADLYKLFRTEKAFLFLLFVFVLLTASFNSSFSLCMLVIEKKREIRLLAALGMQRAVLGKVFLYQAAIVNALGWLLGMLLGVGICQLQMQYEWFYINASQATPLPYPVDVSLLDVLLASCTLIPLCWLSSLYPAYLSWRIVQRAHQSGLDES